MQTLCPAIALDEAALRRLLDEIPVGIGIAEPVEPDGSVKPDGRIVYYNKHWVKMFGFDVDDVRTVEGATLRLYPDPLVREEMLRIRYEAAARIRAVGRSEQREIKVMGAGGEWIDVMTGTSVIGDRLVVTMLDISESKRAEDNLQRTLMNLPIPVACGTDDQSPRISLVNHAFTRTFGYEPEEVPTVARWLELAYPDPAYRAEVLAQWLQGMEKGHQCEGTVDNQTVRVQCKDGTVRDVIFSATLLPSGPVVTFQDITQLENSARQAEDARAKAEAETTLRERITLAARAAQAAFWDWDLETNEVTWSPEMMDLFGVPEGDRRGRLDPWEIWRARLHPEDFAAAEAHAAAAYQGRTPIDQEFRIVLPGGQIRWIESRGDVIRNEAGQPMRIAGINIDISARKQAEQTAAAYRTQLEQLLAERTTELDAARCRLERMAYEVTENIPAGTYVMVQPPDGGFARFSFLSARFLEMCGLSRETAEKDPLNVYAIVHPEDYDEFLRKNIETFERKLPFSEEFRAIIRGETRWLLGESNPRSMPDGSTVWEGVLTDITARKEAELARVKSDRSMKLAASAAGIGFWSRDLTSNLEEWDDQMLRIYGVRREDFDGRWEPFVHPDDLPQIQRLTARAAEQNITGRYEYRIVRPDGTVRHVRGMSGMLYDSRGKAVHEFGVNFDITEEKEAAERERKLAARHRHDLEQKLKTSLSAAAVAHEINQPLSAILLDSQMALARIKGESRELEQARAFLSSTISNAERTVDTIAKMMSLLRSVQTKPHEVNLVNVLRSAELYAKDELRTTKIALRLEGTGRAMKVRGDEGQLLLAASNLLRNAIEAIRSGNTGQQPQIVMSLAREGKSIVLSVADNGPGLPCETLAKIPLHTTKPQGTGLGLFIVKSVADNHGAKFEARQSQLGGAELRLVFPATKKS